MAAVEIAVMVKMLEALPPAARVTLAGLRDAVSPLGVEEDKETVPVKPFKLEIVIVEVPDAPC